MFTPSGTGRVTAERPRPEALSGNLRQIATLRDELPKSRTGDPSQRQPIAVPHLPRDRRRELLRRAPCPAAGSPRWTARCGRRPSRPRCRTPAARTRSSVVRRGGGRVPLAPVVAAEPPADLDLADRAPRPRRPRLGAGEADDLALLVEQGPQAEAVLGVVPALARGELLVRRTAPPDLPPWNSMTSGSSKTRCQARASSSVGTRSRTTGSGRSAVGHRGSPSVGDRYSAA